MRRVGVGAQYICFWEKEQTDNQIAFAANVTKLKNGRVYPDNRRTLRIQGFRLE